MKDARSLRRARGGRGTPAGESAGFATPPTGFLGFVYRWYPALWIVLELAVASEVGGFAARFDPSLGSTFGGIFYSPSAYLGWLFATKTPAVLLAIGSGFIPIFVLFLVLLSVQRWDQRRYGRSWGAWEYVLILDDIVGSITLLLRGIPP